ncbi:hypothetical protein TOPH_02404 [Tolypocladium ophioglossoides CBS 100239]|uniref:N-acetyltransferase domain-containing protein n=1 Tax=Tolypocladium ophioglossoides (strain CBS 100239) TaxID=1163406 RepID=A0A0L0NGN7_TOLOC|nr:hypothetical protein TOPH_02404 [Tolypocladium ophioglossoides CBS 100239]
MHISISAMDMVDAEHIVRKVDFPAMQDGPLYRLMFPSRGAMTEAQQNEIIRWYAEGLRVALRRKTDNLLQICASDGTPLGFCGWTMEQRLRPSIRPSPAQYAPGQQSLPEALDRSAWLSVSSDLRKERERVLKGLGDVCRLTFMSVHPHHQRHGLGSTLLKRVCDEIDKLGRPTFVMASPAGVRLYAKFGFDVVGTVETCEGTLTSMLRRSRPRYGRF